MNNENKGGIILDENGEIEAMVLVKQSGPKPEFKYIMLSLSLDDEDRIKSIAAVKFNLETGQGSGGMSNTIIDYTLEEDEHRGEFTLEWLKKATLEDKKKLWNQPRTLREVLKSFNQLLEKGWDGTETQDYILMGTQQAFNALTYAYSTINQRVPWIIYNERDIDALIELAPEIKESTSFIYENNEEGKCHHQIKYCSAIHNKIKENGK